MKAPAVHPAEPERLLKLNALNIVYSPAEERFDRITRLARKIFDVPIALVSLVTEKCQWFKSAQGLGVNETPREISFCGHAILRDDALVVPDTLEDPDFADNPLVTGEPYIRFYAGQPLIYDGSPMGTLCIIDRRPRSMSAADLETLRSLAAWAENELSVAALSDAQQRLLEERDEARRASMVDPLTRVWNRKGIEKLVESELSQASREKRMCALMLIDIDHYKNVNDTYGHAAGDVALQEVAQRIRASIRPHDILGRFGGDEFLVCAIIDSKDDALRMADRITLRVRDEPIDAGEESFSVTASVGVCLEMVTAESNLAALTECADAAMYETKKAGRDGFRTKER
jgi:diguanylate cyclase (GGDEF)-like protein